MKDTTLGFEIGGLSLREQCLQSQRAWWRWLGSRTPVLSHQNLKAGCLRRILLCSCPTRHRERRPAESYKQLSEMMMMMMITEMGRKKRFHVKLTLLEVCLIIIRKLVFQGSKRAPFGVLK